MKYLLIVILSSVPLSIFPQETLETKDFDVQIFEMQLQHSNSLRKFRDSLEMLESENYYLANKVMDNKLVQLYYSSFGLFGIFIAILLTKQYMTKLFYGRIDQLEKLFKKEHQERHKALELYENSRNKLTKLEKEIEDVNRQNI